MEKHVHEKMADEARQQRAALESQIEELRVVEAFHLRQAGVFSPSEVVDVSVINSGETKITPITSTKSWADTIVEALVSAKRPLTNSEIVVELKRLGRGGNLTNASYLSTVSTTLKRHPTKFEQHPAGGWAIKQTTKEDNMLNLQ